MTSRDPVLDVEARVAAVRARIEAAARRAGRDPAAITLVGVCKRQPLERIAAAVRAGVDPLGESYVQEARDAIPRLAALLGPDGPRPRWHLVGRLQRNKTRLAAQLFDVIESVDRPALAVELDRRAGESGRDPDRPLEVCLQVNLSGEPQKGGAAPEAVPELLRACAPLPSLRVVGLMTVPAAGPDPEASRSTFAQLRSLRDTLTAEPAGSGLRELSMGMSGDFETAIEEGATWVRVGTALFGDREDR